MHRKHAKYRRRESWFLDCYCLPFLARCGCFHFVRLLVRNLPKAARFEHPSDLRDALVEFRFCEEKGHRATAWHIKVLQVPGRSQKVALGGPLLCDYDIRIQGQIAYKDSGTWGFLSVHVDLSGLSACSEACRTFTKVPTRLFFHCSELPHQLCSCRRASDLCGVSVEFKLVASDNGLEKAVRLRLLDQVKPKRRKADNHMRGNRAQQRREHCFMFEAGPEDPFAAEQQDLLGQKYLNP